MKEQEGPFQLTPCEYHSGYWGLKVTSVQRWSVTRNSDHTIVQCLVAASEWHSPAQIIDAARKQRSAASLELGTPWYPTNLPGLWGANATSTIGILGLKIYPGPQLRFIQTHTGVIRGFLLSLTSAFDGYNRFAHSASVPKAGGLEEQLGPVVMVLLSKRTRLLGEPES